MELLGTVSNLGIVVYIFIFVFYITCPCFFVRYAFQQTIVHTELHVHHNWIVRLHFYHYLLHGELKPLTITEKNLDVQFVFWTMD